VAPVAVSRRDLPRWDRVTTVERWATFDCYGTLVDWRGGIRRELARLFPGADTDELLARYYELEPTVQLDGSLAYRDVLARTLAGVARASGLSVPAGEEDALGRSLPGWPVFADTRAALAGARERGWRLGILTNSDRDLIEASVGAIGVDFDLLVAASEIGSYKPALRHWEVFRDRTGVGPDRHVHVAQSLFHDIAATVRLGVPSIWINRLDEPPDPRPTRTLPDLAELDDTLDALVPA
jgi:2-haloacid dehalogenase